MMTKSKFTPGPWVAEQHRDCGIFRIKAGDQNIASLSFWNESNEEANAELMAEAPALLEVLDTLYDCIDHEKLLPSQLDAYHRARELLAKHGG
jgi:hypothetical protein